METFTLSDPRSPESRKHDTLARNACRLRDGLRELRTICIARAFRTSSSSENKPRHPNSIPGSREAPRENGIDAGTVLRCRHQVATPRQRDGRTTMVVCNGDEQATATRSGPGGD
jgi:hypothetical protein